MFYAYEFVSFFCSFPIEIYTERKNAVSSSSSENSSSDESSKENEDSASTSKCKTREYVVYLPVAYFLRPF